MNTLTHKTNNHKHYEEENTKKEIKKHNTKNKKGKGEQKDTDEETITQIKRNLLTIIRIPQRRKTTEMKEEKETGTTHKK